MSNKTVFFGIMAGDLFGDVDPEAEGYDAEASLYKYAELCEQAIKAEFAKHGEVVEVSWNSQNASGVIPWGLKTRVDGETDHEDVEFVDNITGRVWQEWEWVVEA